MPVPNGRPDGILGPSLTALLIVLVAAYAGLTLAAPGPSPLAPPAWDAGLFARLFPGVPPAWVALRLCIIAGVVCLALFCARLGLPLAWMRGTTLADERDAAEQPCWPGFTDRRYQVALAVSLIHLGCVPFVQAFPRGLQLAYVALLAVPAVVLAFDRRAVQTHSTARRTPWPAIGLVAAAWAVWRVPGVEHSPLLATATDSNIPFELLRQTLDSGYNLMTDQLNPGFTAVLSVLQGAAPLGIEADALTLRFMQTAQVAWALATAALLGRLTATLIHPHAAPLAVAVYLFSPFTTATVYLMGALFLGGLAATVLLALWSAVVHRERPWALASMGAAVGLSATHPALLPLAAGSVLSLLPWIWRRPAARPVALLGAVSGLVAVVPGLPQPSAFVSLSSTYTRAQQMWVGMEAGAFGTVPPGLVEFQRLAGVASSYDGIIGVALAPWATPRTPMRLWGDVIIEPIGAALFALGLGIVIAGLRRSRTARQLLWFLLLALLPGILSSYDRPSLTRAFAAPLLISLIAAVGFRGLARQLPGAHLRLGFAAAVTALVAASGTYLFDRVQPRLLARSSVSIALASVDATRPCPSAMLLVDPRFDPQQSRLFAAQVPRCPIAVVAGDAPSGEWLDRYAAGTLTFWSPGFEDAHRTSEVLCVRQPQTTFWILFDAAELASVFAAGAPGIDWQPAAGSVRWETRTCGQRLPTERKRADEVLAEARLFLDGGEPAQAIARLRRVAEGTFVQTQLYRELALLLRSAGDARALDEAVYWSWRASVVERHRNAPSVRLHAELLRDAGRAEEARRVLRSALDDVGDRLDAEERQGLEELLRSLDAALRPR